MSQTSYHCSIPQCIIVARKTLGGNKEKTKADQGFGPNQPLMFGMFFYVSATCF